MSRVHLSLVAGALVTMSACAAPVFTAGVRDQYELSPQDIQHVQFFTSEEIRLDREVTETTRGLSANQLAIHQGERLEEVRIPAGTPGVALRVAGDYVLIGFSSRDLDSALWFALEGAGEKLATAPERKYLLVMLQNSRVEAEPFVPRYSPGFLVPWSGSRYRIAAGRSAFLRYAFDESLERRRVERRPPGWQLSEGAPPAPLPARPHVSAPTGAPAPASTPSLDAGAPSE